MATRTQRSGWVGRIWVEKEFHVTTSKQQSGFIWQRRKDLAMRNLPWGTCMNRGAVLSETTVKQFSIIPQPPSRGTRVLKTIWAQCMRTGTVCEKIRSKRRIGMKLPRDRATLPPNPILRLYLFAAKACLRIIHRQQFGSVPPPTEASLQPRMILRGCITPEPV